MQQPADEFDDVEFPDWTDYNDGLLPDALDGPDEIVLQPSYTSPRAVGVER